MGLNLLDAICLALFYGIISFAIAPYIQSKDATNLYYLNFCLITLCCRFTLSLLTAKINASLCFHVENILRNEILDNIIKKGPFSKTSNQDKVSFLTSSVDSIMPYFSNYLVAQKAVFIVPLVLLLFILFNSTLAFLVLIIICPLVPIFLIFIGKITQKLNQRQWQQILRLSSIFNDVIRAIPYIKINNLQHNMLHRIYFLSKRWRIETMNVLKIAFLSSLVVEFFTTVGIAFCAILLGFAVLNDGFSYISALFVLLVAPEFFLPLRNLGKNYHAKMGAIATISSLLTFIDVENKEDVKNIEDLVSNSNIIDNYLLNHDIVFSNATVLYEDGTIGLNNKSFTIQHQKINTLIGPSGVGKSTVLKMIYKYLKLGSGSILLGDKSIFDFDTESLRKRLIFIPQTVRLMRGTLFDNLKEGNNFSDEFICKKLEQYDLLDLVKNLFGDLDRVILDNNEGVSGGQAKIIALLHAILLDRNFIILDEPTASLDAKYEAIVIKLIQKYFKDKTVLVVSHRQNLIQVSDNVIHLGAVDV